MRHRFVTIDTNDINWEVKIQEFLADPTKDNIKLRAFNPSKKFRSALRPMTLAAWMNGTLVMRDPYRSWDYYNYLHTIKDKARLVISSKDIHEVDTVTHKKMHMGAFLSTFK